MIDPAQRVENLIRLTERLTALMAAQAAAFENRRPREAAIHLEELSQLANAYRHESTRVKADPSVIKDAPSERRGHLTQVTEAFHAVMARHGRALEAVRTVTEGLVHAIATEIANQRGAGGGYGADGANLAPASAGTAIALNRSA